MLNFCDRRGGKGCKSDRSRHELSNEYLFAKIGVDTAENEPLKVHLIFRLSSDLIFTEPPRPKMRVREDQFFADRSASRITKYNRYGVPERYYLHAMSTSSGAALFEFQVFQFCSFFLNRLVRRALGTCSSLDGTVVWTPSE